MVLRMKETDHKEGTDNRSGKDGRRTMDYHPLIKKILDFGGAAAAVAGLYWILFNCLGITCPVKFITGISCAGCGMTRAWIALLHLDIEKAFYYHPLFFLPPVAVILFLLKKRICSGVYKFLIFTIILLFAIIYTFRLVQGNGDIVVFHPEDNILLRVMRYYTQLRR